jgi:hypothetical protein
MLIPGDGEACRCCLSGILVTGPFCLPAHLHGVVARRDRLNPGAWISGAANVAAPLGRPGDGLVPVPQSFRLAGVVALTRWRQALPAYSAQMLAASAGVTTCRCRPRPLVSRVNPLSARLSNCRRAH